MIFLRNRLRKFKKPSLLVALLISTLPVYTLASTIEIGGVIEAEMYVGENFDGNGYSDLILSSVEIALDAEITESIGGHILLLHEETSSNIPHLHIKGQTGLLVDEGYVEFGNSFLSSFSLQIGHIYIPFGSFESNMISDPFTLELGQSRESALVLTYDSTIYASIYLFNGDLIEVGGDDSIDNIGYSLGYLYQGEDISFNVGVGYINNIKETDGMSASIIDNREAILKTDPTAFDNTTAVLEYTAGFSGHIIFNWGSTTMIAEIVAAMDDFTNDELYDGRVAKPSSSNLEIAYRISNDITIALGVQETVDLAKYLPENRALIGVTYQIDKATTFAFEIANDSDYTLADGGTGESASSTTLQFSTTF
jgi:hypothetical protein